MNASKPIAILAAMLITTAGMYGIVAYSNAASSAHGARGAATATAHPTTLPAIEVRPTPAQLREVHGTRERSANPSAAASPSDARMPFYSFAADAAGA